MALPKEVGERIAAGLKRFQPVLTSAKSRDLAFRLDGNLALLLEVKAIGLEPKDQFIKQAVDYAANQGTGWVVLTNGEAWRIYRTFGKPIEHELVLELNLPTMNHKSEADLESLYHLSSEGWRKSALHGFHQQRQAHSRFFIAALINTDPVADVLRRELRLLAPDVKIDAERIREVLLQEVLKRDAVEGEKAEAARKRVVKVANRVLGARGSKPTEPDPTPANGGSAEVPTESLLDPLATTTVWGPCSFSDEHLYFPAGGR